MNKTLLALIVVALLITALVAVTRLNKHRPAPVNNAPMVNTPTNTEPQTPTSPQPQIQTYHNSTYGFSFQYPASLSFVTPTYPNLQDKIVQVQIPQAQYPKTNFSDAAFGVSAQATKTFNECLSKNLAENTPALTATTTINNTKFYKGTGTGAAAGNLYQTTTYRTWLNNQMCVELTQTIHTGNIANFPAGTVTAVDSSAVQKQLDDILNTFKFN